MKLRKRFGAMLVLVGMMVALMPLMAVADHGESHGQSNTCKDQPGFDENFEKDSSGLWGSITGGYDDQQMALVVNQGWEVTICFKKGSGDPQFDSFTEGEYDIESQDYFPNLGNDGFSHYGFYVYQVGTTTTTTTQPTTTTTEPTTTTTEDTTTTSEPRETTTTAPEGTTTVPEGTTTPEEEVTTTTTEVEKPTELPFTGPEDVLPLAALATMLLASGGFVLRKASQVEEIVS